MDKGLSDQLDAQFEGLRIGLEQKGESSGAHCISLVQKELGRLRATFRINMLRDGHDDVEINDALYPRGQISVLEQDYNQLLESRDAALKFIMDVGLEFVEAGYPAGDREVIMANVRKVLRGEKHDTV